MFFGFTSRGDIYYLHIGQVGLCHSHSCRHALWKEWHCDGCSTLSRLASSSSRHIAHSQSIGTGPTAGLRTNLKCSLGKWRRSMVTNLVGTWKAPSVTAFCLSRRRLDPYSSKVTSATRRGGGPLLIG